MYMYKHDIVHLYTCMYVQVHVYKHAEPILLLRLDAAVREDDVRGGGGGGAGEGVERGGTGEAEGARRTGEGERERRPEEL